jgi:hypothetical protein
MVGVGQSLWSIYPYSASADPFIQIHERSNVGLQVVIINHNRSPSVANYVICTAGAEKHRLNNRR